MSVPAHRSYLTPRCFRIVISMILVFFIFIPGSAASNSDVCNVCKSAMYMAGAGLYYFADVFGLANLTADYVKSTIEASICAVNPAYCGYVVGTGVVMTILDGVKKWPDAAQWGQNIVTNICIDPVNGLGLCPSSIYYPQGVSNIQLDSIYRDSENRIFARFQWDDAWIQDGSIEGYRIAIYRENGVPLYPSTSYNRERHAPQACVPMIDACCREGTCYSDVQFEEGMTGTYAAVIFSYDAENDQSYGHYFSFNLSYPSKPSDVSVQVSGSDVTLSWRDPGGNAEIFWLHYRTANSSLRGEIPLNLEKQANNSYSLSFSGIPDGTYYFKLASENPFGKSAYTSELQCTVSTNIPSTYTNSLGQTFKLIPAGTFIMGSPSNELGRRAHEGPQHQVTLTQPFYMQITEVTQAQWEAVMGNNPSYFSGCPTCPVEQVSWNDVQEFIARMNARGEGTYSLPTEAQWEYAARAGSTTAFYNGGITTTGHAYDPNLDAIGWHSYNSGRETHPVGQKAPNAWGLYDMSGNLWEWCQDWYSSSYYGSSPATDPTGPSSGSYRVVRGGGWIYVVECCRSAERLYDGSVYGYASIGFRLTRQP